MNAWVNSYSDLGGKDAGTLLSLSPNLHIVLSADVNHQPSHTIGLCCPKCGQAIEGRNIFPVPQDTRVLGCNCLTILFGAASFPADWIVEHWSEWSRIRRDAESQLAAGGN